jgi:tetratricopeptide (TPR) repeat protein
VSSTADEWKSRGAIYFDHNNYQAALYSFERAGEEALAAVCRAHILLRDAEELERSVQSKSSARKAFIIAGEAFDNLPSKARKWQRMAADCFGKGGNNIKAAERYKAVGLYDKAIQHYWEGKGYDEASEVLSNYRSKLSPEDEEKYEGRLRSHYVRLGDFQ